MRNCHQCDEVIVQNALCELESGKFFCNEDCYKEHIRSNLSSFMDAIKEYYRVVKA